MRACGVRSSRRCNLGCADSAAVQHLMATDGLVHQRPSLLVEVGSLLSQYERPLPQMRVYDDLSARHDRSS